MVKYVAPVNSPSSSPAAAELEQLHPCAGKVSAGNIAKSAEVQTHCFVRLIADLCSQTIQNEGYECML